MIRSDRLILPHVGLWLFLLYCIISFHFTDLKLAGIKLNEFVALLTIPFLLYTIRHVNKYLLYFLALFVGFLLVTFASNTGTQFYTDINGLTLLKGPYLISIARFVELMACLAFALIVYKAVRYYQNQGLSINYILRKVLTINLYVSLVFLLIFLLVQSGVLPLPESTIIYDTTPYASNDPTPRLRGYYVEGGPLGLFYSSLYMLTFFVSGRKWVYRLVFLLVIIAAQSKAGMAGILAWHFYLFYRQFRHASWFRYVILAMLIPVFYFVFTLLISNYLVSIENFEALVEERKGDYNFVMGRIAALFITPNMVMENPLFGIGLGNYALVRNDPAYLGILPPVPEWDAPGLGVFVTILVENGLIGFMAFLALLYAIYKNYAPDSIIASRALKVFILICLLGVQLHFLYIWFFIGLALAAPADEY
ncbi:O-antigen ligase family protein [Pontibacter sp. HSC-14F20]|uniref:O-antigen ligase family protein n=1 Tax=Pontibacter sp. HSC-14F20 TaxID=2864136 RepID=UPI001C73BD4F|nr:O-antigen ligase family protein [Pontibacter sp. HSC-14F20]MBX0331701.1 O-antigen ligase family protein [Pontibacter sp. HSC-14F20]